MSSPKTNLLKILYGIDRAAAMACVRNAVFNLILAGLCAAMLAACAFKSDDSISYTSGRADGPQTFPTDYRAELLAFMRSYLNDPSGIRQASIAEPVQRTVGGRLRYVTCLRYSAREAAGYSPPKERAVIYVEGRLDRLMEDGAEICTGSAYGPFPELEKLTR
jgi:hypothetical protein